jgi:intracellular multiplication protein IcmL
MDAEGKTALDDALVLVHTRNQFYRGKFRFVLSVYVLSLVKNPTEPLYFPADSVGRLLPDIPSSIPNMSNQEVVNWTIEAVESAYSYDYVNYRSQLQNSQKYFTNFGWRTYMDALRKSNNISALKERQYVIIAKVVGPPKLIRQDLIQGAMAWKFEMPVLITYLTPPFGEKDKFTNAWIITVIVQRQNALQSYKGLGIIQSIATFATTPR